MFKQTNTEDLKNNSCCMKKSKNVLWKKVYENLYELLLAAEKN